MAEHHSVFAVLSTPYDTTSTVFGYHGAPSLANFSTKADIHGRCGGTSHATPDAGDGSVRPRIERRITSRQTTTARTLNPFHHRGRSTAP